MLAALALLLAAMPAWAGVEFYQTVDRVEVGTEDTFRLTVVVMDPPDSAQVQFPPPEDFEVLSSSQSTQRSIVMSGGGPPTVQTVRRHVLVMRANRAGPLTIPPAVLRTDDGTYRTEPIKMKVREGRLGPPPSQAGRGIPDPFRNFPFGGFPDSFRDRVPDDEPLEEEEDIRVPRGDSDLFLRASLDKEQVYVGEQVTLALHIYSRVDLSSVDSVTMPKLEGFWSEDVDSPTQLSGEQRTINGVPYRAYLLRRRALFPVKSGTLTIAPAEADITTGFLFAGHRVHRVSNRLEVKVKPLPPGAPPGMSNANVGEWRLSLDVAQTRVELGQPVTVKVILEGTGNVKNVTPPKLTAPAALKVYDPTTTDRLSPIRARIQGRRVQEYLLMPQRTGTFTLPALEFPYFNPGAGRYEVARTEPVDLLVEPGAGGATVAQGSSPDSLEEAAAEQKNVLTAGGLRPLRYHATFEAPSPPVWQQPFFLAVVLAPLGLLAAMGVAGMVRGRLSAEDEGSRNRQRARAARKRLAAAEQLLAQGSSSAFYGEVEKALRGFLEARLHAPVAGLTHDALEERLASAGVAPERRARVRFVLEACDAGRFAPGAETTARERVLDDAAAVMEGWEK